MIKYKKMTIKEKIFGKFFAVGGILYPLYIIYLLPQHRRFLFNVFVRLDRWYYKKFTLPRIIKKHTADVKRWNGE